MACVNGRHGCDPFKPASGVIEISRILVDANQYITD
jgi:hypothetical protein